MVGWSIRCRRLVGTAGHHRSLRGDRSGTNRCDFGADMSGQSTNPPQASTQPNTLHPFIG